MTVMAVDEGTRRQELKAKRNRLFQKFLKNPTDVQLALEIKVMDDQVAESTNRLDVKKKVAHNKHSNKPLVG